ncbi:uncharacterized protein LOC125649015 isoform X2 [Ostrea edulis]|uniref:uncharacterized protein LOC125649015 isoform X2 n=1 Tax=Ostrea edulis TaxID=37623 RepID=UPI0024AF1858|nr:uncharacterized protein LOC125649015 isoform X2 [Ostrea edulis]XP_056022711.1 uncharacterized protein LOC125649015 isoform X2 [Ostrea edulis]XP_056022712.1 uncharacterized protein LOC125649015 isoform X2 [Ostrea edulis]XP_056022713.1 uncharacterized protein LOC125649015 isoform X2 [Ostrea edulis]
MINSNYELHQREPCILPCCHKSICSRCLEKILDDQEINKKCPNCQKTLEQETLTDFSLNVVIQEALNFQHFGEIDCDQCTHERKEKAIKICNKCGSLCSKCCSSHNQMKIFRSHEISSIPVEKWSINLLRVFKHPIKCESHKNQNLNSFCERCKKVICKECIEISHKDCKEAIHTVEEAFKNVNDSLKGDLKTIDLLSVKRRCLLLKQTQEQHLEDIDREIDALKQQCLNTLKSNFDAVRLEFQNKAQKFRTGCNKTMEQIKELENSHNNICSFIEDASLLQNKVGFLQCANQVKHSTEYLRDNLKQVDKVDEIDYLSWIKEIFSDLHLSVGELSVVFALGVAEECNGYPSILDILKKYRFLTMEKERCIQINQNSVEQYPTLYDVNFEMEQFPRYHYHFDLVQKMLDSKEPVDKDVITSDVSTAIHRTILVSGTVKENDLELLKPLTVNTLTKTNGFLDKGNDHAILIFFTGAESRIQSLEEEQMIASSAWSLFITSETQSGEKYSRLKEDGHFSIVAPDPDAIWNSLTSALELPLIEILKERKRITKSRRGFLADIDTVIRRIENCSAFTATRAKQRPTDIPQEIRNVLKRFEIHILRYGFYFYVFRVIVHDNHEQDVKEALTAAAPPSFRKIVVIPQNKFKEEVKPFTGKPQAQGGKLYQSNDPRPMAFSDDLYGTLGCLAILNRESTVALSCRHVCVKQNIVYIENELNERIPLGQYLYNSKEKVQMIQSDLAIIRVDPEAEKCFSDKRLLNHMGNPTKTKVSNLEDSLELFGEIVHKLGATSQWTQGKIVSSEIIENLHGVIAVQGMNDEEFGKPGDSGSIVFRELLDSRERKLEVVAVLTAGKYESRSDSEVEIKDQEDEQSSNLVLCLVFKTAFENLKKCDFSLQSITFFND